MLTNAQLIQLADELIPPGNNKKVLSFSRCTTGDIINEVLACYKANANQLKTFAPYLQSDNVYNTCLNIWQFLKLNIRYREDADGVQLIKTPAMVWQTKICDCKGYAIFIACCLKALRINGNFRFASFDKNDSTPTHVYIFVKTPGREIIIDDVKKGFDKEQPYYFKHDYPMTAIYRISGIDNAPAIVPAPRNPRINKSLPVLGITEAGQQPEIGFLRGLKHLLSGNQAKDMLVQIAPALLYVYIPNAAFAAAYHYPDILSQMPDVVQKKAAAATAIKRFTHNKWGYKYSQSTGMGGLVRNTLTDLLGMDPQVYLAKVIGYNINNYAVGTINAGQTLSTTASFAASGASAGGPIGAAIGAGVGLLTSIVKGVINYNIKPDPASAVPQITDWAGFQTAMQLGRYIPTEYDPLGALGTNGGQLSAQAVQQPMQVDSQGNLIAAPAQTSGMNPWILAALASGALMMIVKNKKK